MNTNTKIAIGAVAGLVVTQVARSIYKRRQQEKELNRVFSDFSKQMDENLEKMMKANSSF